jgi:cell division protein FtsB
MTVHTCKFCHYVTNQKCSIDKHFLTQKHKNNVKKSNENNIINKIEFIAVNQEKINKQNEKVLKQNEEVKKQNDEVKKQNDELRKKIEQLEKVNNMNTNKIVKEARSIKKSILTILNTNFKNTPSIDYIDENEFRVELEKEYNRKINDKEYGLFMRIFRDYENKKLIQTLSNLILKFIKKEDQKNQSVFNIDSARGNYATKVEDYWLNDKSGVQLKKYTLDMIIKFMLNVLDVFRQKLEVMIKNKNKTSFDRDYIMKYQDLFLEVRAYLTNVNTHKKVILFMCPELRLDQKILDTITN